MGLFKIFILSFIGLVITSCTKTIDGSITEDLKIVNGTTFRVNFKENHKDGFTWQLEEGYDKSIIQYKNSVWEGNENGVYFYFQALKPGTTQISFIERKYDSVRKTIKSTFIIK